ncbi:MAG: 16S rRNA (uracil(1498)-N(3))-methyltransferase [Candidatus Berkiella sp.]
MFVPRIYYPHPLAEHAVLALDKEINHYLCTVLRLEDGDKVIFFNGEGGEYSATYIADKKKGQAKIGHFNAISRESPLALHLGQALLRGDKMDYVIQKATELGASSITPIITVHCGVKLPADRTDKRLQHWQSIAQSACEQSGRTMLPTIHSPISLNEWAQQAFSGISLFGHTLKANALNTLPKNEAYRLAIGPESGFDDKEVITLQNNDFLPFTLGPRILRTETAGLVAISVLQNLFGDLGLTT